MDGGILRLKEGRGRSGIIVCKTTTSKFAEFFFSACPSEEVALERSGSTYWVPSIYLYYLN